MVLNTVLLADEHNIERHLKLGISHIYNQQPHSTSQQSLDGGYCPKQHIQQHFHQLLKMH
jgi:hypothetical protein